MTNIIKRLLEQCNRYTEFAYTRNKALDKMQSASEPINTHIMKLILWGWNTDWSKTVFDISVSINAIRLKPSNSRLDKTVIERELFRTHFSSSSDFVRASKAYKENYKEEYGSYRDITDAQIKQKYEQIVSFVSKDIAEKPDILRNDFISKLKQIV